MTALPLNNVVGVLRARAAVIVAACLAASSLAVAAVDAQTTTTTTPPQTSTVPGATTTSSTSTTLLPPDEQTPVDPPAAADPEIPAVGAGGSNATVNPTDLSSLHPTGDNSAIPASPPRGLVASLEGSRPLERRLAAAMLIHDMAGSNLRTALDTMVHRVVAEFSAHRRVEALSADQRVAAQQAADAKARLRRLAATAISAGGSQVSALLGARNPSEARERLTSLQSIADITAAAARDLEIANRKLSDDAKRAAEALGGATAEREHAQAFLTTMHTRFERANQTLEDARVAAGVGPRAVPDIPNRMLVAYLRAAQWSARVAPACRMTWWVLAGIGRVESGHAGSAAIGADGSTFPRIIGIALDGSNGTAVISDSDGGSLDNDTESDRAVGPMQFIPSTWRSSGVDASGDGVADPHNIFDATFAAARYLCAGARGLPVDTEAGFRAAAFSYNHSASYVQKVWDGSAGYRAIAAAS